MSKHTPGPWRPVSEYEWPTVTGPRGMVIAEVRRTIDLTLVSAAPDLLEALKALLKATVEIEDGAVTQKEDCHPVEVGKAALKAHAAIAKAEGKP